MNQPTTLLALRLFLIGALVCTLTACGGGSSSPDGGRSSSATGAGSNPNAGDGSNPDDTAGGGGGNGGGGTDGGNDNEPVLNADGWPDFDQPPSGRANQGTLVKGEFIGSDEIHFARGANADGRDHEQYYAPGGTPPEPSRLTDDDDAYRHSTWGAFGADRAPHNGDYLLPTDTELWPDFTADIAFLRMEATATDLYVHVRFLSFPRPEAQIATITFTGVNEAPQVAAWPQNAGISSAYSQAFTLHGTGGLLTSADGVSNDLTSLGGAFRVTNHALEARIPISSLPSGSWNIGVGAGLADPAQTDQYWTVPAGSPTASSPGTDDANAPGSNVWDLMFTPHDPLFHDDHVQARLLAAGDVSVAVTTVNPSLLQARATQEALPITGRIAHVYESAFDFGDGLNRGSPATSPPAIPASTPEGVRPRDAAVNYEYLGGVQPYFAYIPKDYAASTGDRPLVLYFHGLNNYIWEPFGLTLGLEDELDDHNFLFASTLGRGDISYTGRGELDPLEIIEHMSERYRVDRNRIYILGHSHGGGGVTVISRRNPDKFAAVVAAQINTMAAVSENLLHVPTMHIYGAQDPIDAGPGATSRYNALRDLGYDSQLLNYTAKTHENSSIYDAISVIFDLFESSVRDPNPATVVFTRAGGDFSEALGLLHDGAYWVSNMVADDASLDMKIRAESFGIEHQPLDPDNAVRTANVPVTIGGEGNKGSGRDAGFLSTTVAAYGAMTSFENRAEISTENLSSVTLDTSRMEVDPRAANASFDLELGSDLSLVLLEVGGGDSLDWRASNDANIVVASGAAARESDSAFTIELPASAVRLSF